MKSIVLGADTELKEDPSKLFDVLMPPTNSNEAKQSKKTVNITRSKDEVFYKKSYLSGLHLTYLL